MENRHCIILAVALAFSLALSAKSAEVAGITLPNEDDVLVQMLLDDQIPMEERTELINETLNHIYPATLPPEERSRGLMRLVRRDDAPFQLRYLAAATMTAAGVDPPELGEYLVAECKRDGISREWLSFCLRQLDSAYFRVEPIIQVEIVELLTTTASRERGDVAGTALLVLWRIGDKDGAVKPVLQTLNRALLSTKGSDLELMIAALEVASDMNDAEALPIAKRLAYSDRYGVRLRLAAVNAILTIGDSNDAAELVKLQSDKDIGVVVGRVIANRAAQR